VALFEPERHEALCDDAWDEARACAAIDAIAADAQRAYLGADGLWPIHPLDRSPERPPVLKALYNGAAGVIWALRRLGNERDYGEAVCALARDERLDGYLTGRVGMLLLEGRLEPDLNLEHPSLGVTWGGPGNMLAALFMLERTGDARWRELYRRGSDFLSQRRDPDGLWTHDLYGHRDRQLGALHGFAGNAYVLLRGRALLPPERQRELLERVRATLHATALREGGHANWRMCAGATARPGASSLRVQHCMGAPGFVNAFAGTLPRDPADDALLLAAGELTWAAGPTAKLPSLCHGTPGSGYAFLKLHARTGDARWLERARRFAMHAIGQAECALREHGQRKFSLWTGDLGLALYLKSCLDADPAFPTLDVF